MQENHMNNNKSKYNSEECCKPNTYKHEKTAKGKFYISNGISMVNLF